MASKGFRNASEKDLSVNQGGINKMARYIEVNTPQGSVFMEVDEGAEIMRRAGGAPVGPIDTAAERFRKSVDVLSHEAEEIIKKLRQIDLAPDEVTVSFGIKAAGEIGAPIFALANEAEEIIKKLRQIDLAPDEVTVSFGIKAAGEIGAPIFALAKGSVEAGYNITMKWKREETNPVLSQPQLANQ
jgi:hypothetical protein